MVEKILANLIYNLQKRGYINEADEVSDILKELLEEDDSVQDFLVGVSGLRGDQKPEQPSGGLSISVEPFFAEKGEPL
jgi:hypothetical protein